MKMRALLVLAIMATIVALVQAAIVDPDLKRNVSEIIIARGYPEEDHNVITPDGFILSVQRIPGPRWSNPSPSDPPRPVVVLQHGLEDNSFSWVSQAVVTESLGFVLADAGYDVWMPNVRGNTYSSRNNHLDPSDPTFWAWTFDEMAKIDMPAYLDYIESVTGQSRVSYVGHSQGTMMGFIAFENPDIQKRIKSFAALAPVAWVGDCSSLLIQAMAKLNLDEIFKLFGLKQFLPDNELLKILLPITCKLSPELCDNSLALIMGWDTKDLNNTRLPVIVGHEPSGTSVTNMAHWAQILRSKAFQAYDWGSQALNEQHYGQLTPPFYNPALVTVPTGMFYGGQDMLADIDDVEKLLALLPNIVVQKYIPSYAHLDFVWGVDANVQIFPEVLDLIKKYQ